MGVKFVSFTFMLIIVLSEAEVNWDNFLYPQKIIIDYFFPKNPNIVRVNNSEEARTADKVAILNFIGLVERHGYPAEEHYVTTEDGYNLVIHRIPGSPLSNSQQRKEVVFLLPGILCTSDCWVLFGPGKDLAFLLADQGYDVWIGNFRGNSYCRSHIEMSPQNGSFWQFSYHEIGTKDLPIMIDYILNNTKHTTLRYIGHSMGTTILFVLLSMKPEYNEKIILGICLAPIAIWKEIPPVVRLIINKVPKFKEFLDVNEIYELAPLSSNSITMGRTLCADNTFTQGLCVIVLFLLVGFDSPQLNTTTVPEILSYYPAGTSVNTLYHYYQNIITHNFESYDYGYHSNCERYKQRRPIKYDLKKITAPLALFYGINDLLAPKPNVLEIRRQLPNVILFEENSYNLFNHLDFIWALNAKSLLYDRLMEVILGFDVNPGSYLFSTT